MSDQSANSSTLNNPRRCQHVFDNGTRCRLLAPSEDTFYCPRHAHLTENRVNDPDITTCFPQGFENLDSAANINVILARILVLLAKGRISSRRAAVLAYLANQLLRTLPIMDREAAQDAGNAATPQFIVDIPRPHRHPQPLSDTTHIPIPPASRKEGVVIA